MSRYPLVFGESKFNEGANVKKVHGIAKKDCECAFCCDKIKKGDSCYAFSKWWNIGQRVTYFPWEHQIIICDMELIPADNEGASDDNFNALMGLIKTQFKRDESI